MKITTDQAITQTELKELPLPLTCINGVGWEAWQKFQEARWKKVYENAGDNIQRC